MKVLIIGAGNMGKTYARSFLASRFIDPNDLYILERATGSVTGIKEIPHRDHAIWRTIVERTGADGARTST